MGSGERLDVAQEDFCRVSSFARERTTSSVRAFSHITCDANLKLVIVRAHSANIHHLDFAGALPTGEIRVKGAALVPVV